MPPCVPFGWKRVRLSHVIDHRFFALEQKAASNKQKKQKEAKTFLEVDFVSRAPRREPRESTRGGRPARGRGEGRGRGGASRGSTRGQARSQGAPAPAVSDASAFPALA